MGVAKWALALFASAFVTMILIFIIKKAANKYNIPGVQQIAEGV